MQTKNIIDSTAYMVHGRIFVCYCCYKLFFCQYKLCYCCYKFFFAITICVIVVIMLWQLLLIAFDVLLMFFVVIKTSNSHVLVKRISKTHQINFITFFKALAITYISDSQQHPSLLCHTTQPQCFKHFKQTNIPHNFN